MQPTVVQVALANSVCSDDLGIDLARLLFYKDCLEKSIALYRSICVAQIVPLPISNFMNGNTSTGSDLKKLVFLYVFFGTHYINLLSRELYRNRFPL